MTDLCKLAMKYGTDKCPLWNDGTGHAYTPFYDRELSIRPAPRRMLEIGICSNTKCGSGPSLRMWADYFPDCQIHGIDNCPWVMLNWHRIHSTLLDQSKPEEWDRFLTWAPTFDLIIDDGSHLVEDQVLSANKLMPLLAPAGLYIIEDVQHGTKEEIQSKLIRNSEVVELDIHRRGDDRLIIIRG